MGRLSTPVEFSLGRKIVLSPWELQESSHEISFNDLFNQIILRSLKERNMGEIPFRTYVLEEINYPQISLKKFISEKLIKPRSIEDIYANAVNFVNVWTQPGDSTQPRNKLYSPHRKVMLHLGYLHVSNVEYFAFSFVHKNKYKIFLKENAMDTQSGDFWLI
jgi:hypothetical protein